MGITLPFLFPWLAKVYVKFPPARNCKQRDRVVRAPGLKSGGRGFKFFGRPSVRLVNSQPVCLPPVGIFKPICLVNISVSFSLSGMLSCELS